MEELKTIFLGIVMVLFFVLIFFAAMDREAARLVYLENVKSCKPVYGCLFDHNCNHYNKMIEEECK